MEFKQTNFTISTQKRYLSSETNIYKTEGFLFATKKIAEIDKLILSIAENLTPVTHELLLDNSKLINRTQAEVGADFADGKVYLDCFRVETLDKQFSFLFVLGGQLKQFIDTFGSALNLSDMLNESMLGEKDIVFFADLSNYENLHQNDQRASLFLKKNKIFSVMLNMAQYETDLNTFKKLYFINGSSVINMPLLSSKQRELVEIENKNVMVQGVAGSGKTNICISKLIFVATRNYSGRVLYSTFSRGLLVDTKSKIDLFVSSINSFIEEYQSGRIIFLDKNHKRAISNRLGLSLPEESDYNIIQKLKQVSEYLKNKIDYFLIEDLYNAAFKALPELANEKVFVERFLKGLGNHQLNAKLKQLKNLSTQIIYREIYGMLGGKLDRDNAIKKEADFSCLSLQEYTSLQQSSFDRVECEIIYNLAKDYDKFKKSQNLLDYNDISYKLLEKNNLLPKYSLTILDEVQDFTEINLKLFDSISLKMMCVGDALQMINPSYFGFAFLKKLMYKEDITEVAELEYNFRNNKSIAELLNKLGEINIKQFGTHSFVVRPKSVDESGAVSLVYTADLELINRLKSEKFENFTVICVDAESKKGCRNLFARQEVLSVAEIKGLERDTVLLYNILSGCSQKWKQLERLNLSHKQADENSVYRYYFNLFYVALSRAKHNVFIYEDEPNSIFEEFFKNNFENLSGEEAYKKFTEVISKIDIDDDEILARVEEFIKLGQFDNARFYANKLYSGELSSKLMQKIDIFETLVFKGKNREAGISLWKAGLSADAKTQFQISGDNKLIEFLDSLESKNMKNLDAEVVKFFTDFSDNPEAQKLIVEIIKQDLETIKKQHVNIKNELKLFKEKYYGK